MKNNIITFFLGILLFFSFGYNSKAESKYERKELPNNSISRIIREPLFDRAIKNHSFITKNSIVGGLSFNYFSFDSKDSKLLFAMIDNINYTASLLGLSPYLAYSFSENQVIGFKASYSTLGANLPNMSLNLGNIDLDIQDLYYKQSTYGLALFYRSYVGLDPSHRFALFNELSLSYKMGDSRFEKGNNENKNTYLTDIKAIDLGMSPGVAIFISQNICMEMSFNIMGFNYRKESQSLNDKASGSYESSGIDFSINPFNINFGITLSI